MSNAMIKRCFFMIYMQGMVIPHEYYVALKDAFPDCIIEQASDGKGNRLTIYTKDTEVDTEPMFLRAKEITERISKELNSQPRR